MSDEGISYEMLQDLLRAERRVNRLLQIPMRFWPDVRTFLDASMASFREEQAKDPFSRKVMMLTDQVKNARSAAQALWALRERKLATAALVHDGTPPSNITPEEAPLYEAILAALQEARGTVFEPTATEAAMPGAAGAAKPTPAAVTPPATAADEAGEAVAEEGKAGDGTADADTDASPSEPDAAEASDDGAAPDASAHAVPPDTAAGHDDGLVTIRALGDIPPFVGPDMQTYLLKEGDLATVPPSIAKLLERRGKAALVESA